MLNDFTLVFKVHNFKIECRLDIIGALNVALLNLNYCIFMRLIDAEAVYVNSQHITI